MLKGAARLLPDSKTQDFLESRPKIRCVCSISDNCIFVGKKRKEKKTSTTHNEPNPVSNLDIVVLVKKVLRLFQMSSG